MHWRFMAISNITHLQTHNNRLPRTLKSYSGSKNTFLPLCLMTLESTICMIKKCHQAYMLWLVAYSNFTMNMMMPSKNMDVLEDGDLSKTDNSKPTQGRYNTNLETKMIVWVQSAGHCELCGSNLTKDYRAGTRMKWGRWLIFCPPAPKGHVVLKGMTTPPHRNGPTTLLT